MLQQSPSPFFTVLYQYLGNLNFFLAPLQGYTNASDPPTHRSKKGKKKKTGTENRTANFPVSYLIGLLLKYLGLNY